MEQKKLCALVIGHKSKSPGAVNKSSGATEFDFNEELAKAIESEIERPKTINPVDVQRVYRRTYSTLPDDINELDPDFIISLHCNAFDSKVSGSETLYYYKSEKGKRIARIVQKHIVSCLVLKDRGIKPRDVEDRGGSLLKYTNAPCVIVEPFFIDNDYDYAKATKLFSELAKAYADAILEIATNWEMITA